MSKIVTVCQVRGEKTSEGDTTIQVLAESGYSASYSQLKYAASTRFDMFKDQDPKVYFATTLKALLGANPNARAALQQIPDDAQKAIAAYVAM